MFFRSIAAARGDGVAMVLSGSGTDGAMGVRAVKEAGGVIMVQEPAEAEFPSMPQNAIADGVADFVAPVARLAERLAEVAQSKEAVRSLDMDGAANELRRIVAFLRARTGHDFASYKRATVMRRAGACSVAAASARADRPSTHCRSNWATHENTCRESVRDGNAAIVTDDIVTTLQPIWLKVPETARQVRDRIERVFDAARVADHRKGENPARRKRHLELMMPRQRKSTGIMRLCLRVRFRTSTVN